MILCDRIGLGLTEERRPTNNLHFVLAITMLPASPQWIQFNSNIQIARRDDVVGGWSFLVKQQNYYPIFYPYVRHDSGKNLLMLFSNIVAQTDTIPRQSTLLRGTTRIL